MSEAELLETIKMKDEKIAELLANHAAINTALDRLEPKIERTGEQSRDLLAFVKWLGKRAENAEADRDRARQTIKERTALLVRLCGAVGVSTDADEDDIVGAFGAVKANEERLRGEVVRLQYILDLVQSSLDLAIEAGKAYDNPTLRVNCQRDLELVKGLLAKGFGAPEAAVIKAAVEVTEFLNHPIESHGARIQRLWETVQAMLAGKEADRG